METCRSVLGPGAICLWLSLLPTTAPANAKISLLYSTRCCLLPYVPPPLLVLKLIPNIALHAAAGCHLRSYVPRDILVLKFISNVALHAAACCHTCRRP